MPAKLSTHVLDTSRGRPAAGMKIELWALRGARRHLLKRARTNADGRTETPLLQDAEVRSGQYELVFFVGDYFKPGAPERFLDRVPVRFRLKAGGSYHVPLLCSPWSYATYPGELRMDFAAQVLERVAALSAISDEPDRLTRLFAGPGMRRANELVGSWMEQAGMAVRQDAIGNLIGRYPGGGAKTLLLGSHLDTVRDAGKFDGVLGVVLAIACVERCRDSKRSLPFSIEIIAFADEEGVRYQSAYLGSRAVAGCFALVDLERTDAAGIKMTDAILAFGGDPARLESCRWEADHLLGYVEAHIEQGPVLDSANHAVGLVTAIAGQTRARIDFHGRAGHAGTVPMNLRRDALCAAAEFTTLVEQCALGNPGLVATVGQIAVEPNAANVIPGAAWLSLDLRHQEDAQRREARRLIRHALDLIQRKRLVKCSWQPIQDTPSVPCSPELSVLLRQAALKHQPDVISLPSGAGHDAAIMARITPAAMLFVRCREGLSHHPDESARPEDIGVALEVLFDFVGLLAERHEHV